MERPFRISFWNFYSWRVSTGGIVYSWRKKKNVVFCRCIPIDDEMWGRRWGWMYICMCGCLTFTWLLSWGGEDRLEYRWRAVRHRHSTQKRTEEEAWHVLTWKKKKKERDLNSLKKFLFWERLVCTVETLVCTWQRRFLYFVSYTKLERKYISTTAMYSDIVCMELMITIYWTNV